MARESLKVYENLILKKDDTIDTLTKALDKQIEKSKLQRDMMEWKLNKVEGSKEAYTNKIADKFYKHKLKLKAFLCWHYLLIKNHKSKFEKACKKKAEEVCLDLASKYESRISNLEGELEMSKAEIETYKHEMVKNEENIKKVLIRSVHALNIESKPLEDEPSYPIEPATSSKSKSKSELNRKVKDYCESSLKQKSMSAVSKAKLQLLNTNHHNHVDHSQTEQLNDNYLNFMSSQDCLKYTNSEATLNRNKLVSGQRVYDELTKHSIPENLTKKPTVKSKSHKLDEAANTNKPLVITSNTNPFTLPPYRSIIIEKHSSSTKSNNEYVRSTTSKVKYTPPALPATVLNTVVSYSK